MPSYALEEQTAKRILAAVRLIEAEHRNGARNLARAALQTNAPQLVRLVNPLFRGSDSAGAIFQDFNTVNWVDSASTATISGIFARGYYLQNDRLWVIPAGPTGQWSPISPGRYGVVGTLAANLVVGGSQNITVDGQTVTVWERYGAVNSGKLVGAGWDDAAAKFFVNAYNC